MAWPWDTLPFLSPRICGPTVDLKLTWATGLTPLFTSWDTGLAPAHLNLRSRFHHSRCLR